MEQDIPDYDMDSEDERWLVSQAQRLELSPLKFEEMMDRLEKSSGQTVVTLNEAKALLKEDDDLIIAVFDYWLNKRLKTQHPLILAVKTEHRAGTAVNNPYLAFRRRTEKMQTRKNRKNDETSYEKMLKLRRDLYRAVTLLELIKRREKIKREYVHLTVEIYEKRYQAKDFSGAIMAELSALKSSRPAFTPIFHNHYTNQSWTNKAILKDEIIPRKEKRQYKKRKHKSLALNRSSCLGSGGIEGIGTLSSDEEPIPQISPEPEEQEDEGQFAFRRNKLCSYHMPISNLGNWPWCSKEENGSADKKYRYTLTSLSNPRRCIGFARRRMGRGGRVILDRVTTNYDDLWRTLDFTIFEPNKNNSNEVKTSVDSNSSSDHFGDVSANSYLNLSSNTSNGINSNSSSLRTGVKTEFGNFHNSVRTSVCDVNNSDSVNEIKRETGEVRTEGLAAPKLVTYSREEQDEMTEFLETVRNEWLHFKPKTPPPDYEPPCHLLPADDPVFVPSANTPFSLEIKALEEPSTLLDTSTFMSSPITFEDFALDSLDVPITDTRQSSDNNVQTGINLNVNVGLNTLTSSVNNSFSSNVNFTDSVANQTEVKLLNSSDDRTIGCSKFSVSDIVPSTVGVWPKKRSILSSTLTSPKLNSVNIASDSRPRTTADNSLSNANGLVTQFGFDATSGNKTKNNKIPYAYSSGADYSSTPTSTLSLHTSAHTVTLNSHSANILEIPLTNDADTVTSKVNSQCAEPSGTSPNNKNKTIVRKNNLVMEVT